MVTTYITLHYPEQVREILKLIAHRVHITSRIKLKREA